MMMTAQSQESMERESHQYHVFTPTLLQKHHINILATLPLYNQYSVTLGRLLLCMTLGRLCAMASFSENAVHQRIIEIKTGNIHK